MKNKGKKRILFKDKWPPRSPDLNPYDFLWGNLKSRTYPLPKTLDELKANTERKIIKTRNFDPIFGFN
jgi:transposase